LTVIQHPGTSVLLEEGNKKGFLIDSGQLFGNKSPGRESPRSWAVFLEAVRRLESLPPLLTSDLLIPPVQSSNDLLLINHKPNFFKALIHSVNRDISAVVI